jgi:hypothetical protein
MKSRSSAVVVVKRTRIKDEKKREKAKEKGKVSKLRHKQAHWAVPSFPCSSASSTHAKPKQNETRAETRPGEFQLLFSHALEANAPWRPPVTAAVPKRRGGVVVFTPGAQEDVGSDKGGG